MLKAVTYPLAAVCHVKNDPFGASSENDESIHTRKSVWLKLDGENGFLDSGSKKLLVLCRVLRSISPVLTSCQVVLTGVNLEW